MSKGTAETASTPEGGNTEFTFQAEVARLLQLMVHSVYSEKEVFLRELISNGADACDKLRYQAITEPKLMADDPDLRITIEINEKAGTLSVADNGIGMTRSEMIDNLGTIARSGTKAFLDRLAAGDSDVSLIGQFGVGFYSAFMVADRVDVLSRKAGAKTVNLWSSDGASGFDIAKAPKSLAKTLERGTIVTLHLKDDDKTYLQESEIERIVRAYSDHVTFPINLVIESDGKPELRQLNAASALWTRPKSEIDEEHYREFYHHVAGLFDQPAITIHYRAEGRHEYSVLLFVPSTRPFDLFDPSRKGRIKLYVKRVFITDDAEIVPAYLRFVRGLIDSEDMPLNISREMLQNNPIVASIRKAVTGRVLSEIAKLAEDDEEKFISVWEAFGGVLKEGLYEDFERRDEIFEIARFRTSAGDGWRSLKQYISDMRENQTAIFYIIGESMEQLRGSPQLEGYRARGVEVLLLTDPVDNFWVTTALGYEGKPFQSVTQGEADVSNIALLDDKEADEDSVAKAEILGRLKTVLADAVEDVRASKRLVESPACLVASAGGPDRAMEMLIEKQMGEAGRLPVLEVNLGHPLVKALDEISAKKKDEFDDLAWLLLDEALILEGRPPADPAKFSERINRLILAGLD